MKNDIKEEIENLLEEFIVKHHSYDLTSNAILSLFTLALSQQRKEIKEKVKKMKKHHPDHESHTHIFTFEGRGKCGICKMSWKKTEEEFIYNIALSNVISLLEKGGKT